MLEKLLNNLITCDSKFNRRRLKEECEKQGISLEYSLNENGKLTIIIDGKTYIQK